MRLTLAFRELDRVPPTLAGRHATKVIELDLSNNNFQDLQSIEPFRSLQTLILDHNRIDSSTRFPPLPHLETLWLNHNNIKNLVSFVDHAGFMFPRLKHLSMLNNLACPNYFNGGTPEEYADYRHYVIRHFPHLETLDNQPVRPSEVAAAMVKYGAFTAPKPVALASRAIAAPTSSPNALESQWDTAAQQQQQQQVQSKPTATAVASPAKSSTPTSSSASPARRRFGANIIRRPDVPLPHQVTSPSTSSSSSSETPTKPTTTSSSASASTSATPASTARTSPPVAPKPASKAAADDDFSDDDDVDLADPAVRAYLASKKQIPGNRVM